VLVNPAAASTAETTLRGAQKAARAIGLLARPGDCRGIQRQTTFDERSKGDQKPESKDPPHRRDAKVEREINVENL